MTSKPKTEVVVQREFVKPKIPPAYLASCGGWWRKEGGPAITQDWIDRGDQARAGLACRDAQIAKIKKWDQQ